RTDNRLTDDDLAKAWVTVRGRRAVLLLGASARSNRYLEEALSQRGFRVDAGPADRIPDLSGFGAVILNDVPLRDLPRGAASEIRSFVRGGGGLVMVGGTRSFGLGGYGGSPIEEALPVRMKPREREEPRNAVALLIDKSGSMKEERRIFYAQAAARELVERMNDGDLLTVIGFDREAFVVVPLREIRDVRDDFEYRIGRLRPIGGTRLYPALVEARRALGELEARRHIIVLSDGLSEDAETSSGQRVYYDLALALSEQGITISTIALGRDADLRFLERLASFGRGAFHQTDDPSSLPELVIGGLEEEGREKTFREERIRALPARDSDLFAELVRSSPRWPSVLGLVETELKRGARLDVSTPDSIPLVASWRYGEGRAVAFTTDGAGRWSDPWVRWEEWSRLWGSIAGWLIPQGEETDATFALGYDEGAITVEYTRFDEDPAGSLEASLRGPNGL
ncbi:MAG: glutamine amidotransferase, partial [Candidatus Binatia bacterium]